MNSVERVNLQHLIDTIDNADRFGTDPRHLWRLASGQSVDKEPIPGMFPAACDGDWAGVRAIAMEAVR